MQEETEIGRELFGYNKDDVDRLLAELHREIRLIKEENDKNKEQLASATEKLATYEDISDTLKKTMINAEKTASELIDQAHKESAMILARAKTEASNIVKAADTERQALESGYRALEVAEKDLQTKIKSILGTYTNLVENISPDAIAERSKEAVSVTAVSGKVSSDAPPNVVVSREEVRLPDSTAKALTDKLAHLADIQGVGTAWVFDNNSNILSSFNRLKINLSDITAALTSLSSCAEKLEDSLQGEDLKLMFLELNNVVLVIYPLTGTRTLGVISSTQAPIGQILWFISKESPELREIVF